MNTKPPKVRFAPSPTGYLHVGGLRTALFNYLFAKKHEGAFLLRIEDTDQKRKVEGADNMIMETLQDFKLQPDNEPVYQSERLELYKKYAYELVKKDLAYEDEGAIRQKLPREGETEFEDQVFGRIKVENFHLDESVLLKSDGFPTYNFANVIDDHEMRITHVLRGEEFIPSTPKHVILYNQLGWEPPSFAHLPLILDKDKKKLSKRTGDVSVSAYQKQGYLKEALLNFIAFLGWNPKTTREIFSLQELVQEFSLEKVNKAGAVFDIDKLDYINREWQKRLNLRTKEPMYQRTKKLLEKKFRQVDEPLLSSIWPQILERVKGPSQLEDKLPEFYFFFTEPEYDAKLLIWKDTDKQITKHNLKLLYEFIQRSETGEWDKQKFENRVKNYLAKNNMKTGEALWPLRVALTGLEHSPGPFEVLDILNRTDQGKQIVLKRIEKALEKLG